MPDPPMLFSPESREAKATFLELTADAVRECALAIARQDGRTLVAETDVYAAIRALDVAALVAETQDELEWVGDDPRPARENAPPGDGA
jgi:hypothetical protein